MAEKGVERQKTEGQSIENTQDRDDWFQNTSTGLAGNISKYTISCKQPTGKGITYWNL
jgi:hypothetical protein